jgi:hypothetical protein
MIAVITGDIINSRKASNENWLEKLKEVLNQFGISPKDWQIYRGDSFQLQIQNPSNSILTAIFIKSAIKTIKNLDARMSIGIGDKSYDSNRIMESNGSAFIYSGYAFDNLLKNQTLAIKSPWADIDEEINIGLSLALHFMNKWTIKSAEFVRFSIEKKKLNQKELANLLNVSQSSISERKNRSGFDEIMKFEKRFKRKVNSKMLKK